MDLNAPTSLRGLRAALTGPLQPTGSAFTLNGAPARLQDGCTLQFPGYAKADDPQPCTVKVLPYEVPGAEPGARVHCRFPRQGDLHAHLVPYRADGPNERRYVTHATGRKRYLKTLADVIALAKTLEVIHWPA